MNNLIKQTPIPKLIIKHADLVCFELEQIYLDNVQLRGIKIFQCVVQSTSVCLVSYLCICVYVYLYVYFLQLVLIRVKAQLWDIKGRGHTPLISLTFLHPECLTWIFLLQNHLESFPDCQIAVLTTQDKDVQLRDLYYLSPSVDPVLLCHLVSITRKPLSSFLGNSPSLSRDLCLKVSLNTISFFKQIFVHTVYPLCQHCCCNKWFIDWHN